MPKIIQDQFEKKDCVISFAITTKEYQKFDELRPKTLKKSELLRKILLNYINLKEKHKLLLEQLSIASI